MLNNDRHADNINRLLQGETIQFRPVGNSMDPKIKNGQLITISPDISDVKIGDAVFCKIDKSIFVHLVNDIQENRYQISNIRGKINGWTTVVYGKVIKVED